MNVKMRTSVTIAAAVLAAILIFTLVQESHGKGYSGGGMSGLRIAVWGNCKGGGAAFPCFVLILSIYLYRRYGVNN